jgi:hypothetical protein
MSEFQGGATSHCPTAVPISVGAFQGLNVTEFYKIDPVLAKLWFM